MAPCQEKFPLTMRGPSPWDLCAVVRWVDSPGRIDEIGLIFGNTIIAGDLRGKLQLVFFFFLIKFCREKPTFDLFFPGVPTECQIFF